MTDKGEKLRVRDIALGVGVFGGLLAWATVAGWVEVVRRKAGAIFTVSVLSIITFFPILAPRGTAASTYPYGGILDIAIVLMLGATIGAFIAFSESDVRA